MASRAETSAVYGAGIVQGIALVTFPAASTILTDPAEYDLSSTQYAALFLPQVITAIAASLLGARLGDRFGIKRVYMAGLVAGLLSMTLLIVSQFFTSDQSLAYAMLLVATACLGAGFGLTVPALNIFAAAFHPAGVDRAILVLNALLGLGTVLAPVFVAIFVGLGFWWGMPVTSAAMLLALLLVSLRLPLQVPAREPAPGGAKPPLPARFWVYAGFAVLYGICETLNGNWSQLDMTSELGSSTTEASLALTAFWGMVTVGRVLFAAIERQVPPRVTYHVLPFVLAGAFVLIALLPEDEPATGILAFGLAGLGCSALLPLTISFGQKELPAVSAAVAGGVIAFYQLGYGIAAFGVGPLVDNGVELPTIYGVRRARCRGDGAVVVRRRSAASGALCASGARVDVFSPSGEQIEISRGDQRAVVVEVGGGLRAYSAGGRELLDAYPADGQITSGRGQVLIPWPNRIEDGAYEFDGQQQQLALDELEARNAIHGLVRWAGWGVGEREQSRVVLEHVLHPQPGYPFRLALTIEYALADHGLSVSTTATNLGPDPCPYGCGFHPYLTLGTPTVDSLVLTAPARTVLTSNDRALPTGRSAVAGTEYDFTQPRAIGATRLDNCFTDLEREDGPRPRRAPLAGRRRRPDALAGRRRTAT